jgi:hypothetical protein
MTHHPAEVGERDETKQNKGTEYNAHDLLWRCAEVREDQPEKHGWQQ